MRQDTLEGLEVSGHGGCRRSLSPKASIQTQWLTAAASTSRDIDTSPFNVYFSFELLSADKICLLAFILDTDHLFSGALFSEFAFSLWGDSLSVCFHLIFP